MSADPWFAFDHKLSWDGLLTFIGGLLAFLGIFYQVHHADAGLRSQLQAEKDARLQEHDEKNRAVSTAMLFEIDRFYRLYIANVLKIAASTERGALPALESPGPSPFPVYATNCGYVGELDTQLAQTIVDFYASGQRHAFRICNYQDKRNSSNPNSSGALLPEVKGSAENLVPLAYIACAYLCEYTGTKFTPNQFETAKREYMDDVTVQAAQDAVKAYRAKLKR